MAYFSKQEFSNLVPMGFDDPDPLIPGTEARGPATQNRSFRHQVLFPVSQIFVRAGF